MAVSGGKGQRSDAEGTSQALAKTCFCPCCLVQCCFCHPESKSVPLWCRDRVPTFFYALPWNSPQHSYLQKKAFLSHLTRMPSEIWFHFVFWSVSPQTYHRATLTNKENDVCKNENRTSFSSPLKNINLLCQHRTALTKLMSTQPC